MIDHSPESKNISEYNLDSRAKELQSIIENHSNQIQTIHQTIHYLIPQLPFDLNTSNQPITTLTITPKPRPTLPTRVIKGYPLREPSPGHDPAVPKAIAPVGLNPTVEEIISWPQRGQAAHRVSFLLNPTMNPAKENIRDLTPPLPASSSNTDSTSPINEIEGGSNQQLSNRDPSRHSSVKRDPDPDQLTRDSTNKRHCSSTLISQSIDTFTDSNHENNPVYSVQPSSGCTSSFAPQHTTHTCRTVSIPGSKHQGRGRGPPLPLPSTISHQKSSQPPCFSDDLKSNDLIGSGKISWEVAEMYWNMFFKTYSSRLTWTPKDQVEMDSVRSVSDLLFASIISVSATALGHKDVAKICVDEAKTLTRCTMFPVRNHNVQDLKGIMSLAIYHGIHSICAHFVTMCLTLKLHKVFVKLTDPNLRGTAAEEELVEKGRTWLMVVIYSHVFCVFSRKMYLICSPRKVITDHAFILRSSICSKDCDRLIQAHVELVSVLATAQDKLDSRRYPGPLSERREKYVLPELSAVFEDLNQWTTTWTVEAPELFETEVDHLGGPATGLRNPQQYVYLYIMHAVVWPCEDGKVIMADTSRYDWAVEGCKYAEAILSAALSTRRSHSIKSPTPQELTIKVEYEKVTLGLATGYLLWIGQVIPGHIDLRRYRKLIGSLHEIEFRTSCEYIDLIETAMQRIDNLLTKLEYERNRVDPNSEHELCMTATIDDRMARDLDRLMTDTRFWFQVDVDREFTS